jgi:hypothetical protein
METTLNITILWDVKRPCSLVEVCWSFSECCCFHHHGVQSWRQYGHLQCRHNSPVHTVLHTQHLPQFRLSQTSSCNLTTWLQGAELCSARRYAAATTTTSASPSLFSTLLLLLLLLLHHHHYYQHYYCCYHRNNRNQNVNDGGN